MSLVLQSLPKAGASGGLAANMDSLHLTILRETRTKLVTTLPMQTQRRYKPFVGQSALYLAAKQGH